ncbi:methylmalonyl-CoA mutase subunit beta [Geodermatophilus obscurus]|uniref:methylmalonyl-CoA mutase n=1 Tax=Geodermatophilus obscurus (strain ATCC 25078 / DSM 43160 / JCM 3152 / CCUG 61914 / KCC A-0152 / KCTC 9177 / NBRC 13315 / NRRL B-3577 / G-20) TaxID=526225 RepID=D2SG62_GEOOG|nr:methylmalonyl-CoA mutase subunit beta [Geodermatophilus obscurus]ADB76930.1 Methylmalonyl-CoA mutase [Geodermatophilus obscurus DSM 43160]
MSSPDQQTAAPADAEVPAEHEVPDELPLAAGFPAATREAWRELVAAVLRKAGREELPEPVEDALRVPVATGVSVAPLYTAEDAGDLPTAVGVPGLPPFVRGGRPAVGPAGSPAVSAAGGTEGGASGSWDVRQRHAHPDVALTREAIAADLENGVTSLWLALGEGAVPTDALGDVLADVYLDLAPVSVSGGMPAAEALLAHVAGRTDLAPGGSLGLDPLGVHAASGEAQDLTGLVDVARRAPAGWRTVVVDGTVFHDAGASAVEELGCSLAAGVAYLRALTDGGLSVDEAFAQLEFRYAASADQFTTIAALRAARRLWDRVGEVSGASADVRGQRQHAVTSSVMTTRRDPWVNMLRTTVACFAAGVGGADVVTVQPFDAALGLPDAFSRRIARNTQNLLVEEAHLARVLDPAGGSWYVEALTDALAEAAWSWFTEIEAAGGLVAGLDSGLVRDRIAAAWDARAERLAHRTDAITGISEFPNLTEKLPERQPAADLQPTGGLPRVRAAQAFEELRDRADAARQAGSEPRVYLATIGPIARYTARASFAGNLFQAGGVATPSGDGASGLADAGTTVACICGTDKDYAGSAAALAAELRAAGATQVWLAGKPSLAVDGIDGYVYAGCDALDVLQRVHEQLGVPA